MGKSETATASIGIKILLSDLILQINETNLNLIKKMLYDGCIEDSNGYYNESYINILGYPYGEDKLTGDYLECKEYLINEFKTNGSYYKSKFSSKVESDLHNQKDSLVNTFYFFKKFMIAIHFHYQTNRNVYPFVLFCIVIRTKKKRIVSIDSMIPIN